MGTKILSAVEYTDYDTTAGNLSATLTGVTGKSFEIKNSGGGGNTLTITYGSNTMIFNDGESGRFTYDGVGWSTQFSGVGGPVYLTSGRKAFDELTSTGISSTGWYTIAELDEQALSNGSTTFRCTGFGGSRSGSIAIEVDFNTSGVGISHDNATIEIIGKSNYFSSLFRCARISYALSPSDTGAKLQVNINVNTTVDINTTMIGNVATGTRTGWNLVPAEADDGLTPGGTTASFLVAGNEGIQFQLATTVNPFEASKLDNSTLYCSYTSPTILNPLITGGTFTKPSASLIIRDGSGASIALTAGTISNVVLDPNNPYKINFRLIGTAPATPFTSHNFGPLTMVCNGTGGKIEWT